MRAVATQLLQVLLACIYRRHRVALQEPDEPWALFPLARPKVRRRVQCNRRAGCCAPCAAMWAGA